MSPISFTKGELRIVISRTVSSDAEGDEVGGGEDVAAAAEGQQHSPASLHSIKFNSSESGLQLKMDSR